MEAAPRLPMTSFPFKQSTENVSFADTLKPYIANYYHEDPESYSPEFGRLETLRTSSTFPQQTVANLQSQKRYYSQLSFLKSRFPMHENQPCSMLFSWKDPYSNTTCSVADIKFEMMCVLYNIAALHSQLGADSPRGSSEEMKIVCTHFQCAAWCFQTLRDDYPTILALAYHDAVELTHAMQLICFAQAQECILEKSMLDNRKATIIAKVAMQVVDYYKQAFAAMQTLREDTDVLKINKYTLKYLAFKSQYHRAIALLYMGQQAEEQQKMGERVAFYRAALEHHEEARKYASGMSTSQAAPYKEALTFTLDVIEGKRKAAQNENEFIYHEEVPNRDVLQEIKGASLVKGIPFNVNDPEVSGPDIFARLVPMQAHEFSSVYSEQKAQLLRNVGESIEAKDQALAEFMSSLQLDVLSQIHQCKGLPQEVIDRAAALSARNTVCQDLSAVMGKLSSSFHDVEAMLHDIQELLKEEETKEKEYQNLMGKRPPSIIATDLSREAAKYQEAHNKASDSNQNLHRAMMAHVTNIKFLAMPLSQLQQHIPCIEMPNPNIDEKQLKEIQMLLGKVEEMKAQRATLWNQLREEIHKDDITGILVTQKATHKLDEIFNQELSKHRKTSDLIEKNLSAQDNIAKALVDSYAQFTQSRKYIQDVITKRNTFITNLIGSFDAVDDLLSKANKGIEFYNKLETNVSKLLQRIKSACKVQDEEREQILLKNKEVKPEPVPSLTSTSTRGLKLKDYLENMKGDKLSVKMDSFNQVYNVASDAIWPPGVRPTPVGSEITTTISNNPNLSTERADYAPHLAYGTSGQTNSVYTYSAGYNQPISNTGQVYNVDGSNIYSQNTQTAYQPQNLNIPNTNMNYPQQPITYGGYHDSTQVTYTSGNITDYMQNYNPNYGIKNSAPVSVYQSQIATTSQDSSSNLPIQAYPGDQSAVAYTQAYQPANPVMQPQGHQSTNPVVQPQGQQSANPVGQPQGYQPANPVVSGAQPPQGTYTPDKELDDILSERMAALLAKNKKPIVSSTPSYSQYNYQGYGENYYAHTSVTSSNATGYQLPGYSYGGSEGSSTNVQNGSSGYNWSDYQQTQIAAQTSQAVSYGVDPGYANQTSYNYGTTQTNYSNQTPDQYQQYYQNQTGTQYYNYQPNQDQQNYYNYPGTYANQTYPTNPQITQSASTSVNNEPSLKNVTKKESSIDLLSGLDFNISQAPLMPRTEVKKEEKVSELTPLKPTVDNPVLPKVVSKQEIEIPSDNKIKKKLERPKTDPFQNTAIVTAFLQEVDKFEKFCDTLFTKTLNGPTNLDLKWKEIQDRQDNEIYNKSISVARCYPLKNRFADILPYDHSRVLLTTTTDDYINASYVKDASQNCPIFIVTQAPTQSSISDFWSMVLEQDIDIAVCLLNNNELENDMYWPKETGKDLIIADKVISLISTVTKDHWIERKITVSLPEKRKFKSLLHLQFTAWPGSVFPTTPVPFVNFVKETLTKCDQMDVCYPLLVHCSAGIGRSGLFCVLLASILEVMINPSVLPDIPQISGKMSCKRRNILRDREHLKFCYTAFLYYLKELQSRHKPESSSGHSRKASTSSLNIPPVVDDPLSSLDPLWATKKK